MDYIFLSLQNNHSCDNDDEELSFFTSSVPDPMAFIDIDGSDSMMIDEGGIDIKPAIGSDDDKIRVSGGGGNDSGDHRGKRKKLKKEKKAKKKMKREERKKTRSLHAHPVATSIFEDQLDRYEISQMKCENNHSSYNDDEKLSFSTSSELDLKPFIGIDGSDSLMIGEGGISGNSPKEDEKVHDIKPLIGGDDGKNRVSGGGNEINGGGDDSEDHYGKRKKLKEEKKAKKKMKREERKKMRSLLAHPVATSIFEDQLDRYEISQIECENNHSSNNDDEGWSFFTSPELDLKPFIGIDGSDSTMIDEGGIGGNFATEDDEEMSFFTSSEPGLKPFIAIDGSDSMMIDEGGIGGNFAKEDDEELNFCTSSVPDPKAFIDIDGSDSMMIGEGGISGNSANEFEKEHYIKPAIGGDDDKNRVSGGGNEINDGGNDSDLVMISHHEKRKKSKKERIKEKKEMEREERLKMRALLAHFSRDQLDRYVMYRRSTLPRAKIKRLMQNITGSPVEQNAVIAMTGIVKELVGEVVEEALDVMEALGETGPLKPKDLREAVRRLKNQGRKPLGN